MAVNLDLGEKMATLAALRIGIDCEDGIYYVVDFEAKIDLAKFSTWDEAIHFGWKHLQKW